MINTNNKMIAKDSVTRKGYKHTALGWIPEDWILIEFSEFASKSSAKYDPQKDANAKKCIELEHLSHCTGELLGYIDSSQQASIKNVFQAGEVLFGKLRPYLRKYWLATFDGVCSSEIWVLTSNINICCNEFLFYLIQGHYFIQSTNVTSGSKMPRADWDYISAIPFSIPPLTEQKAIAALLSTWDKAITNCQLLIDNCRLRKKWLMQQLLPWESKSSERANNQHQLKLLSDILIPVSRTVNKPSTSFLALGIRSHGKGTFLKHNFNPSQIEMNTLYQVKENDLIVNITFAWEGAIAIATKEDDGALVSHRFPTFLINEERALVDYIRYVIVHPRFRYMLGLISPGGAGRNRVLSKSDFLDLEIPLPNIESQANIASMLRSADQELKILNQKLEAFNEQKKGLMQVLLSGQKRLI